MRRVLIVRLDAIGDYILWRNCLRFIRNSKKYRHAHLAILGNPAWRGLAEAFDSDCADEWIWVENRSALFRKPIENLLPYAIWHRRVAAAQAALKARLAARGFDEVISPCAFHDPLLDELVRGIAPITRIMSSEDAGCDTTHVFIRNRAIAAELCGEPCDVPLSLELPAPPAKTNRILLFTGASHWTRRWPRRRWAALARMLPSGYDAFYAPMRGTLPELAGLMASCAAVVSNDTMALHMAAALGVPVVGIVNGVSGRGGFWPYPASALGGTSCAPTTPRIVAPPRGGGGAPCCTAHALLLSQIGQYCKIASIKPAAVLAALKEVLK